MAAIDQIISVQITASTTAVATDSFGIPLLFGTTKADGDAAIRTYLQPADLLEDGYDSKSAEYISAVALYSQTIRPSSFRVAKRSQDGSLAEDLAAVAAIDNSWYCAVFPGLADDAILDAADTIESMTKVAVFATKSEAAFAQEGTDDILSQFRAKAYGRSMLIVSPAGADEGIAAGIVGGQLPNLPGSTVWAYKTIAGVTADALSPTQVNTVAGAPVSGSFGKHGNVYIEIGGVNVFLPGQMANGSFIDTRIGVDSLTSVVKSNIMQMMVDNAKIPYTEGGCAQIESCIRQAIQTHQRYGFLDADPTTVTVEHTPVYMVSATQRAQRIAPPFTFRCRTTGGIQAVTVQGQVNI